MVGLVVALLIFWEATRTWAPVLERDLITLVGCCLVLAFTALLTAETVASRDYRYDADEVVGPKPLDIDHRLSGVVMAVWAPVTLSLCVVAVGLLWLHVDSPAGSIPWFELAGAPAVVAVGHVAGAAIGRWLRFPLAGLIVVLVIGGIYALKLACVGCSGVVPAPSPFLPWHASEQDLPQTAGRLAHVHLMYVAGMVVLFGALAARHWRIAILATFVVAGTAIGLASTPNDVETIQARAAEWAMSADLECELRDGVEYCALPGFTGWIDRWEQVVDGVSEVVPENLLVTRVRQRLNSNDGPSSTSAVWVGTRWTRSSLPNHNASDLAASLIAPTLGLPTSTDDAFALQQDLPVCMRPRFVELSGQARAPVSVLVSALASPSAETYVRNRIAQSENNEVFGYVLVSAAELNLVISILEQSPDEVKMVLDEHWPAIKDPNTSSAELAAWFNESPPNTAGPQFRPDPQHCECTADGGVTCIG